MSFYTSLSGLKGAQTDLSVISNNVANVGSTGFKKSKAEFGDIISAAPSTTPLVENINNRILTGDLYKALREARSLIAYEQELVENAKGR